MAAQMVAQFREQFDIDLTLKHFLENTTVCSLANVIEQLTIKLSDQEYVRSLLDRVEQLSEAEVIALIEQHAKIEPASLQQETANRTQDTDQQASQNMKKNRFSESVLPKEQQC
jgi:predicted DsbA family dithiol-disulfide isomerase